jgi:hypothetical protein
MDIPSSSIFKPANQPASDRLNQGCFCLTLDRDALYEAIARKVGDPDFCATFLAPRAHLFSNVPVFLSEASLTEMLRVVEAVEAAARLPGYRDAALSWAPDIARHDFGPVGAFMGYDFHLATEGARLIEINTNAGGAFLNALLAEGQRACCAEVEGALEKIRSNDFDSAVVRMFLREWRLQRKTGTPVRIAIVDDRPTEQYLYPEFLLAERFFRKHGFDAIIADGEELRYERGRLLSGENAIDLVYNRLVDFSFERSEHAALRSAYLDNAVVITPNPRVHALYADKRNLILLSDQAALRSWELPPQMLANLAGVPRTVLVAPENADQLWASRKALFFKPAGGHGGKAVYRGDKVTKGVWAEIIRGGYVAQEFVVPGERMIKLDGVAERRKMDVRLYTYNGRLLLAAARLYQGQTTNFRTPGGGFAPVFAIPDEPA